MRGIGAGKCARTAAIAAGLALAGCSQVDDALFGGAPGGSPPPSQIAAANPASEPAPPPPPPAARTETPPPEAQEAPPPEAASELGPRIAALSIAPGRDTGTDVGKKTQELREQVQTLDTRLMNNARRLGQTRTA